MTKLAALLTAPALFALAACGGNTTDSTNDADDFAARINGGQPNPEATVAPTVAQPLEGAAPGAYTPGTATDPASATCGANLMGPYIGKPADDPTRAQIMAVAVGAREVRFISPGGAYIRPDPTSPRLNLMIDTLGVIRDARCG